MSGPTRGLGIIAIGAVLIVAGAANPALVKAGWFLVKVGLLDFATQLFLPKAPKQRRSQEAEYAGTVEPRRIIYGEMRVSGMNTIRACTGGDRGQYLHQVLTLAGHQCEDITDVYFGPDKIADANIAAITGATGDGAISTGTYAGKAWIRRYLGTVTQAADWKLTNEGPPGLWSTAHRGLGVAYLAITFALDEKVYASGKPEVAALVKGKRCYDPRLDTTPGANPTSAAFIAWTKNPALQLADYLMDTDLGRGVAAAKIDWDLVVAAANVCDEEVEVPYLATTTMQPRYTCSVCLDAYVTEPRDNIKTLASAMAGTCYRQGGKWRMYAGHALTPSFTLTSANIIGQVTFRKNTPASESYNFVRGTFRDAARSYQEVEYQPRADLNYELADGSIRLPKEARYLTCTDQWEAQRNAIQFLRRSRMAETLTATFDLSAFKVRPFDVGTMTLADVGWSSQRVVCIAWKFTPQGAIELTLQEDDAAIWDDPDPADYDAPGTPGEPDITDYVPNIPSNFTAMSLPSAIAFSWTFPTDMLASDIIELYEYTSSSPAASSTLIWSGRTTSVVIQKTDTTQRYYWLRTRAANGNASEYTPYTYGVPGKAASTNTALVATPSVSYISAEDMSTPITTGSITCYASGGTSPYTYSWTKQSGDTITANSTTSSATTFTASTLTSGETRNAVFRCTVTDNVSATATCDVNVSITRLGMIVSLSATIITKETTTSSTTTSSVTATPTGGVSPYTYSWAKVNGDSITVNSATAATTTFSASSLSLGEQRSALYRVTATDSTSGTALTATADVNVYIDRLESGA